MSAHDRYLVTLGSSGEVTYERVEEGEDGPLDLATLLGDRNSDDDRRDRRRANVISLAARRRRRHAVGAR